MLQLFQAHFYADSSHAICTVVYNVNASIKILFCFTRPHPRKRRRTAPESHVSKNVSTVRSSQSDVGDADCGWTGGQWWLGGQIGAAVAG